MADFGLGELVTLKHHPYFNDINGVYIMADATMTPPVMVITEILLEKNGASTKQEELGIEQLKCEFYSHKTHKIEIHWFYPNQVKKVIDIQSSKNKKVLDINKDFIGTSVILKTWKIELSKKKISLSENATASQQENKTITANLNFLPPVMFILGTEKNKDVHISKKPVVRNRIVAPVLLKCKWFNPQTSVFSESSFTPEALDVVYNDESLVESLFGHIESKKVIKFKNPNIPFNKGNTIGKPMRIFFNHCYYELEYFDYLTNKAESINLSDFQVSNFKTVPKYLLRFAPTFSEIHIGLTPSEFLEAEIIKGGSKGIKKIFRIKYIDKNGITTLRTITGCQYHYNGNPKDISTPNEKKSERFLKAKCFKRQGDDRYFRFDSIQSIELINLS